MKEKEKKKDKFYKGLEKRQLPLTPWKQILSSFISDAEVSHLGVKCGERLKTTGSVGRSNDVFSE